MGNGLLNKIKNDVKKSGSNKRKLIYFRDGSKLRVRFLTDMDDGMEVKFHDNFEAGINVPCQEIFGRNCPYCDEEDVRTRSLYVWSVWNYEAKEVQLFMFPVNNCSPIPSLMAMYETYGTLVDRDYVITQVGKQQNKTFSVVPMDKNKFRNEKAKAFSDKSILKILDKAFPFDDDDDDDDNDYEDEPKKKKKAKKIDDDYEDDFDDEEIEDDENDYESMSAKELYKLCKERDIECKPKKNTRYYINLLEEYDEAQNDWEIEEDDDDWEEED